MADTKKTIVEDEIVEDVVEEVVVKPAKKVNKPKHDPSELIMCRSVVFGELILIGPKTHMRYSWSNEEDLVSWRALHHKYLFEPMIIIEDEDICNEWKTELSVVYDKLQQVDLKAIFNLSERQFRTQIKQLPSSMKSTIQNMAYAMIQDKTLYDLRKIEALDEILGTELKLMI